MSQKVILLFLTLLLLILIDVSNVLAVTTTPDTSTDSKPVQLNNPITPTTLEDLIGTIVKTVLGVVGSLALVMFIYGGLTWMTAAGNQEKVSRGQGILVWATLGLVVIFTAYVLVNFVFTALGGK